MRFPIRYQLMLPLLAVAVFSLAAVGVVNAWLATAQTRERIEKQLQAVVAVLAESNFPLTDAVLRQMGGLANTEFVLVNAQGRELASSLPDSVEAGGAGLHDDRLTAKKIEDVTLGPVIELGPARYFHSSVRVEDRSPGSRAAVLHILFPQDEFDAAWRDAFLPPLVVGGAALLAVALVTHWFAARMSRVLRRLGDEVQRLAEGDFSPVALPDWNDETRDLALAVNQTAEQLADYETEIRRTEQLRTVAVLGASLAHEMRNAATGCRMAVDLHSESCQANPRDDTLQVAKGQLTLMENRLQRFLQFGKQTPSSNKQAVDLAKLVDELTSLVHPAAKHAAVTLQWKPPEERIIVSADEELLGQAVMNLLLNALDAARKASALASDESNTPSEIMIDLRGIENEAELVVTDTGDGPRPEVADSIFDPFVTEKSEGVGLGLAVAQRIVESYEGHIAWRRDAGKTLFTIRLPLAKEPSDLRSPISEAVSHARNGKRT